jgi:HK97 family phage prohead protease
MPIPSKEENETNEEFIERCMSDEFMKEYDDNSQRLAVCYAQLEDDEERQTNFPNKGDDKKISLRNSEEPQFDYDFAKNIKEQTPEIWKAGGNIRGNEAFMLWGRARDGQDTEAIRDWIKERESWIKRHFEDGKQFKGDTEPNLSNVGGVVAQIKWGTIGTLGEQGMKDVILELTKKLEGKKEENQVSAKVKKGLENKVKKHNEEIKELDLAWNGRTTYAELVKVFERGVGAFYNNPSSVRPNISGPEMWAMARVNSFLFALKKGRFQGGKHDTDLLPDNHPVKKEMEENNRFMKKHDLRHIQKIEETDDSIIITYDKLTDEMEDNYHHDKDEKRGKVGSMIVDGIELPLYDTKEEAEAEAEKLGGSGSHEHTMDGKTYYMPFDTHEQAKEALKDKDMSDHNPDHDEDELKRPLYMRNNPNAEVRTFDVQDLELRMDGDKPTVVGYGAVFNSQSNDLGGFREFIAPGAFDGRLEDDVRFLVNHDANLILARTTNGTLRLSVDEKGLRYEADLPNTSTARDLMELLKNGTISQSSFAFTVEEDSWEVKDGMNIRTIDKVSQLYDVSSVTYPAYNEASSSVALRSMKEWQEKEEAKRLQESLKAEKLEGIKEEEDLKKRSLNEMRLKILKNKY